MDGWMGDESEMGEGGGSVVVVDEDVACMDADSTGCWEEPVR